MTARPALVTQSLLLAALCLLAIAAYLPGLSGDYMFDDMPNLLNNYRLQLDDLDYDTLHSAAYSSGAGLFRRPISMVTFALNRYFYGTSPWSFKVTNLAIHLLTGIGIFLLVRLLIESYRTLFRSGLSGRAAFWLPVIISGLWLVHPLNLTPVLYIVQRMTSLAAMFTVFGLCLYTAGRQRMLAGRHGIAHVLTGFALFGALATLSKETGVLMPLYMLVIEISLFRFRNQDGSRSKFVTALFVTAILIPLGLFLAVLVINPESVLNYHSRNFTLLERVLTESRVLVFYLKLIIMPSINELGLYHDDIALSRGLLDPPTTLYSMIALSTLLAAAGIALLKSRPLAGLGVLWFFAGHALESTIFQLDIAYEHRNYLADMGILLAVCTMAAELRITHVAQVTRAIMPVFFLAVFTYTTWLRAGQWGNNVDHAFYEARHHPDSFLAVSAAARIYARLALHYQPGAADSAYAYLARASELDDFSILVDVIRIKLSYLLDRTVEPAWFDNIMKRLSQGPIKPTHIDSLHELANCIGMGCDMPVETMEQLFQTALDNDSLDHLPVLHADLLNVYSYFTINKTGDFEKGRALFSRTIELDPKEPQRWINLTQLLIAMERYDEAEQLLDKFIASDVHGSVVHIVNDLQFEIDTKRKDTGTSAYPTLSETLQP